MSDVPCPYWRLSRDERTAGDLGALPRGGVAFDKVAQRQLLAHALPRVMDAQLWLAGAMLEALLLQLDVYPLAGRACRVGDRIVDQLLEQRQVVHEADLHQGRRGEHDGGGRSEGAAPRAGMPGH